MRLPMCVLLGTDQARSVMSAHKPESPSVVRYTPFGFGALPGVLGFRGELSALKSAQYGLGDGHRTYNPVLMRFHEADSMSPFAAGGLNAYAYCKGDPINFTDPTGRMPLRLPKGITATNVISNYSPRVRRVLSETRRKQLTAWQRKWQLNHREDYLKMLKNRRAIETRLRADTALAFNNLQKQGAFDYTYTLYTPEGHNWNVEQATRVFKNALSDYAEQFNVDKVLASQDDFGRMVLFTWHYDAVIDAANSLMKKGDRAKYGVRNRMVLLRQQYIMKHYKDFPV